MQGTLHWVSKAHALRVTLRLYDRLFKVENPAVEAGDFKDYINPDSLQIIQTLLQNPLWQMQNQMSDFNLCVKVISALIKKQSAKSHFQQDSKLERCLGQGNKKRGNGPVTV